MKQDHYHVKLDFTDLDSGEHGFIYIRSVSEGVAMCISLTDNGDIEVVVDSKLAATVADAIWRASGGA